MVCVTRILRTLVHDVGTTSSVAVSQIPICVPTQFSYHKIGKESRMKHGQFPYKCYRRTLCLRIPFTPEKNGEREEIITSVQSEVNFY